MLTRAEVDRTDDNLREHLTQLITAYAGARPVRRIAVIGNAPLDPSRHRAARIDGSDLVIRCNSFALDRPGDEPCLGRRADVVVLNRATRITPWLFDRYRDRLYLRSGPGAIYRRKPTARLPKVALWPADLGAVAISNRAVGAELRTLIVAEQGGTDEPFVVPTSGTIAAWLGYRLFPGAELMMTGFSFLVDAEQPTQWRHHWDSGVASVPVAPSHLIGAEATLLRRWVDDGRAVVCT